MRKFRLAGLVGGVGLLAWLVERAGPGRLGEDLLRVGWWMIELLGIAAARNAVRTTAVRLALGEDRTEFSFARMYAVLLVSEAVKFVAVAGLVFGEAAKGWLLGRQVSGMRAASAVLIDVLLYSFTAALFCLCGIGLFFTLYSRSIGASADVRRAGLTGAAVVAAALVAGMVALRMRWLTAQRLVLPLVRWGLIRRSDTLAHMAEIDAQFFGFRNQHPAAFRKIIAWNFAAHFLSAFEVMAILYLLGLGGGYAAGIVIEGFTKLVEIGGLIVPGDVGLYQGGMGLVLGAMGFTVAAGVSLGIIRQVRSILWAGVGFLALSISRVVEKKEARGSGS